MSARSFLADHARTISRASIVSAVALAAEFAALSLLTRVADAPPWVSFGAVQFLGTTITFLLGRHFTFEAADQAIGRQGARHAVVFGGSFALNTALPSVGSYALDLPPEVAFAAGQFVVWLGWNYPMSKYWVFRRVVAAAAPQRAPVE